MYCHNVPGVVLFSYDRSVSIHLSLSLHYLTAASVSHSVPECLQKASILKHSVPGLNPTSDCFILRDCWNSPCSDWFGSTKQLKPRMRILNIFLFCSLISCLGYIFNFNLYFSHLLHLSWWKILSLSYSSFYFLSPETRCSFKMKVIEYLFWASFSRLGPECLPFLVKGSWMLLWLCPIPVCPLSSRNILQGWTHNFIVVK